MHSETRFRHICGTMRKTTECEICGRKTRNKTVYRIGKVIVGILCTSCRKAGKQDA